MAPFSGLRSEVESFFGRFANGLDLSKFDVGYLFTVAGLAGLWAILRIKGSDVSLTNLL